MPRPFFFFGCPINAENLELNGFLPFKRDGRRKSDPLVVAMVSDNVNVYEGCLKMKAVTAPVIFDG